MVLASEVLTGLVAVLHVYFLVLEMFLWASPYGQRVFGRTAQQQEDTKVLAANQGLYNGFLVAGLAWSLVGDPIYALPIRLFFLGCVVVAGSDLRCLGPRLADAAAEHAAELRQGLGAAPEHDDDQHDDQDDDQVAHGDRWYAGRAERSGNAERRGREEVAGTEVGEAAAIVVRWQIRGRSWCTGRARRTMTSGPSIR